MLKTVLIILVVISVISLGVAWAKQQGYCSAQNRVHYITKRLGGKLDLNPEQQQDLNAFAEDLKGMWAKRQEQRAGIKDQINELLSAETFDRDRAVQFIDGRFQSVHERKRELVDAFADFTDKLSPQQRAQLAALIDDRMGHRWGPSRWMH